MTVWPEEGLFKNRRARCFSADDALSSNNSPHAKRLPSSKRAKNAEAVEVMERIRRISNANTSVASGCIHPQARSLQEMCVPLATITVKTPRVDTRKRIFFAARSRESLGVIKWSVFIFID